MRKVIHVVAVIIAGFLVVAPTQPAAAAPTGLMTVVNSASFVGVPVPTGALLSIFTDVQVSQDTVARNFSPWTYSAPGGLAVMATCADSGDVRALPILYVGPSYLGTQINFYLPNSMDPEPFPRCANSGTSHIYVVPAAGRGPMIERIVSTVASHPGVFSVGESPSGSHVDGLTGAVTPLWQCAAQLPATTTACRASALGEPGRLLVDLTGAEWFVCEPCQSSGLIVELARVQNGVLGAYVAQSLIRVVRASTGIEQATIDVLPGTPAGEYRLRVRFIGQPEIPPPLKIELGQPA